MCGRDDYFMQLALDQAQVAAKQNEVPVGAVLVKDDEILAQSFNQPISLQDPTAHAEILVLRDGAKKLQNYRLIDTTLYVTLEPCMMCVGAMVHARVKRLVYGASDPKSGAVSTLSCCIDDPTLNHKIQWTCNVLASPCGEILKKFFEERRKK